MSDEIIEEKYVLIRIVDNSPEEDNLVITMSTGEANWVNQFLKEQNSEFEYKLLEE